MQFNKSFETGLCLSCHLYPSSKALTYTTLFGLTWLHKKKIPYLKTYIKKANTSLNGMSKVLPRKPHIATPQAETDYNNQTHSQTFVASTPINLTASQLIQPLTTENHEIALASCVKFV